MFSALEQSCCQKLLVNGTLTRYGDPFYGEMMGVFTIFQVNVQTVSVRAFSAAPACVQMCEIVTDFAQSHIHISTSNHTQTPASTRNS